MRRGRSNTIEAGSYEEFLRISFGEEPQSSKHQHVKPPLHQTEINQYISEFENKDVQHQNIGSNLKKIGTYWEDIDFQAGSSPDGKSFCEDDTTFYSQRSKSDENPTTDLMKGKEDIVNTKHKKVMVIGGKQTGRHTLIDSLFEKNSKDDLKMRNCLDLMIKKHQKNEEKNVFKFWIKDAEMHNFDQLIKIHYKAIKFYIFIYKTTDRKSFECLETAIEKARAEVPAENFFGILVGNARHSQSFFANLFGPKKKKREVNSEEGEKLRQKYGLSRFIEANLSTDNWKKEILEFLLSEDKE